MSMPRPQKSAGALGIASFVFGILSLLICWIPLLNLLTIPLGAIGALLGVAGLAVALLGRRSGVGWPITGIVLCAAGFGVAHSITAAIGESARRDREARAAAKAQAAPGMPVPRPAR